MVRAQEEIRKGPWTEHEDVQLVFYVNLFGDRRWDFIAKVSGLKRTGKSCRLRWVNYLHPGLKRGKMTPHEERLILELHSKWGNRWSRIARKLPGRTDNEIKNYWRTHMRKKAQERKRAFSPPSSSTFNSSSPPADLIPKSSSCLSPNTFPVDYSIPAVETKERSFYDTGGALEMLAPRGKKDQQESGEKGCYSMDDIWKDIALSEADTMKEVCAGYSDDDGCKFSTCQTMASPIWNYYCSDALWTMEEEESKMFPNMTDQRFACYDQEGLTLTGSSYSN